MSAGVSIDGGYQLNRLKINFYLPLSYRYTAVDNLLIDREPLSKGKIYFQPSFAVQYSFSTQLELTANGVYQTQTPTLSTLYTGYILQNYRNINRYDTQLFDANNMGGSLGISYKNIMNMLFAGGNISYNYYHRDGMYGQTLDSLLTVTQLVMHPNSGIGFSVTGRISKGFNWKRLVLSTDGSWGKNESDQLRQESFVRYNILWFNANILANTRLSKWLFAEYKASWGQNQSKMSANTGEGFPVMQSLNEQFTADVTLPCGINLIATMEHYYNNLVESNRNFFLVDAGLIYTWLGVRYSLDWTNILNTSKYISTLYSSLNSYYSEYDIRPRAMMLKVKFKLL
jgi:hypothetical protein